MSKVPLLSALINLRTTPPDATGEMLVGAANKGVEIVAEWLSDIASGDLTDARKKIAATVKGIRIETWPEIDKTGRRVTWPRQYPKSLSSDELFGLAIVSVVEAGLLSRFRRCVECSTFFFGDPRSRWCSATCGSKFRVRAKRERDRQ